LYVVSFCPQVYTKRDINQNSELGVFMALSLNTHNTETLFFADFWCIINYEILGQHAASDKTERIPIRFILSK